MLTELGGPSAQGRKRAQHRDLRGRARLRPQHRVARRERGAGAEVLGQPDAAGIPRRGADGEPEQLGHGLHHPRHHRADLRRGRRLRGPQEAAHENTKSGSAPINAAACGETTVGIVFQHDATTQKVAGFPIKVVSPCEGTGYEIGSMSTIAGARNLEDVVRLRA